MKKFLAILLTLCMIGSMVPVMALAEDALPEELFEVEELLPVEVLELEEQLPEGFLTVEEVITEQVEEKAAFLVGPIDSFPAYTGDVPTITLPSAVIYPPTVQDITDAKILYPYELEKIDETYDRLSIQLSNYILNMYYEDGVFAYTRLTSYLSGPDGNGTYLYYDTFYNGDEFADLTGTGRKVYLYGHLSNDSIPGTYIRYEFELPNGYQSERELYGIDATEDSTEYWYYKVFDTWYVMVNEDEGVPVEGVRTDLISMPTIVFTGETLKLWDGEGSNPSPDPEIPSDKISGFVLRCYTRGLGRDEEAVRSKDMGGLAYWYDIVKNKKDTPAHVGKYFAISDESKAKYPENADFVAMLYRLFMEDRSFDQGGYDYWMNLLETETLTREQVIDYFGASPEFQEIVKSYGLA